MLLHLCHSYSLNLVNSYLLVTFITLLLHRSPYIVWTRLFLKIHTNLKLHSILMRHRRTYKLVATNKMTLLYFLVNIHINNQSTLHKVNGVVNRRRFFISMQCLSNLCFNCGTCCAMSLLLGSLLKEC
jgi:hypothetical protein